jgi:hypothetical protein
VNNFDAHTFTTPVGQGAYFAVPDGYVFDSVHIQPQTNLLVWVFIRR